MVFVCLQLLRFWFLWWDVGIKFISHSKTWVLESLIITICIIVEMVSHLMFGCYSHQKVCSESAAERSGVLLLMAAGIPRTTLDHCCWTLYGEGKGSVWRCFHLGCWETSELFDIGRLRIWTCLRWFESFIWSSLWPPRKLDEIGGILRERDARCLNKVDLFKYEIWSKYAFCAESTTAGSGSVCLKPLMFDILEFGVSFLVRSPRCNWGPNGWGEKIWCTRMQAAAIRITC